jgi:hypothetical protein
MDPEAEKDKSRKNDPIWEHETNPGAHSSEWIGALTVYLLAFGSRDFDAIYRKEKRLRNSIIGTFVKLLLFTGIVYLVLRYSK